MRRSSTETEVLGLASSTKTLQLPLAGGNISGCCTDGMTSVNYSDRECTSTALPLWTDADINTKRCFPAYYQPDYSPSGHLVDWYHKYVVNSVVDSDLVGGAAPKITSYTYVGSPAWHYDTSGALKPRYRTWSDWRGYA